jgi:AraC-like DNA-binding protein
MERARELLRHSDASIITISFECGYGNPAHFATAFRRSVGMSPSHYRAMSSGVLADSCSFRDLDEPGGSAPLVSNTLTEHHQPGQSSDKPL